MYTFDGKCNCIAFTLNFIRKTNTFRSNLDSFAYMYTIRIA